MSGPYGVSPMFGDEVVVGIMFFDMERRTFSKLSLDGTDIWEKCSLILTTMSNGF